MTKEDIAKLTAAKKANPSAGRRVLMKLTGISEGCVKAWLKGGAKVTTSERMPSDATAETKSATAISLKDVRVSDNRPQQDQVKRRIYGLKRGAAFPVDALAEEWGVSDDSLRKNARKLECLKYVEVKPFDWVLCVMNPETAEQYNTERK
jgi:hypothetical protein